MPIFTGGSRKANNQETSLKRQRRVTEKRFERSEAREYVVSASVTKRLVSESQSRGPGFVTRTLDRTELRPNRYAFQIAVPNPLEAKRESDGKRPRLKFAVGSSISRERRQQDIDADREVQRLRPAYENMQEINHKGTARLKQASGWQDTGHAIDTGRNLVASAAEVTGVGEAAAQGIKTTGAVLVAASHHIAKGRARQAAYETHQVVESTSGTDARKPALQAFEHVATAYKKEASVERNRAFMGAFLDYGERAANAAIGYFGRPAGQAAEAVASSVRKATARAGLNEQTASDIEIGLGSTSAAIEQAGRHIGNATSAVANAARDLGSHAAAAAGIESREDLIGEGAGRLDEEISKRTFFNLDAAREYTQKKSSPFVTELRKLAARPMMDAIGSEISTNPAFLRNQGRPEHRERMADVHKELIFAHANYEDRTRHRENLSSVHAQLPAASANMSARAGVRRASDEELSRLQNAASGPKTLGASLSERLGRGPSAHTRLMRSLSLAQKATNPRERERHLATAKAQSESYTNGKGSTLGDRGRSVFGLGPSKATQARRKAVAKIASHLQTR